jgi:hypothetical protein
VTDESVSLAEARRNAEQARDKFWASFDALIDFAQDLQDSLAPHNLARDAWDAAKTKGADLAEDAVDAVRKRPIAAGSAVAAIALFIAREPLMDLAGKLMSSKGSKAKTKPAKTRRTKSKRAGKEPVEKSDE